MSTHPNPINYASQQILLAALRDRLSHTARGVRMVETHISWVLLAGRYAYKIKKALDLGFLNFTKLEVRQFYCAEEIRLNSRLAPGIYLDVVSIGGNPESPELGVQPAIEYAVKMRRFSTTKQFDHLLARGKVLPQHMDSLAVLLANFHAGLPAVEADSKFGTPETIRAAAMQNFGQLLSLLTAQSDRDTVTELGRLTENAYAGSEKYFRRRHAEGCVRECHGDLHLGNIVLIGLQPVPFDGIEFNPELRWIDAINEVAFLVMDLLHARRPDLACRFLNHYLEQTGDYAGMSVLRFYLAYRAGVRAKIGAIRAFQPGPIQSVQTQELTACRNYLTLARECLTRRNPALIITHGLPGSGKSTFAQAALQRLQAIRIRSDVERKRLFGLSALEDSRARAGTDIYSAEATRRTYTRLHDLARELLNAGFTVVVDAAFLKQGEREKFYALAQNMSVPFVIASVQAGTAMLGSRITQRRNAANDASEADLEVLQMLQAAQQPLLPHERVRTVEFLNDSAGEGGAEHEGFSADAASWQRLDELLAENWVIPEL